LFTEPQPEVSEVLCSSSTSTAPSTAEQLLAELNHKRSGSPPDTSEFHGSLKLLKGPTKRYFTKYYKI